jgi:hypothetical protein
MTPTNPPQYSIDEILQKYMSQYGMAHNTAFNKIDPHHPKHGIDGMKKVFALTPKIEQKVLAEAVQAINQLIYTQVLELIPENEPSYAHDSTRINGILDSIRAKAKAKYIGDSE